MGKEFDMSVKVNIHWAHRHYTDDLDTVEVEGNTVGDCIDNLIKKFPGMKKALLDKNGKFISYIEIFVNMKNVYTDELAKPVKDGDEIHLSYMLAGG
jgi:molybdopterin converting factor small subunit